MKCTNCGAVVTAEEIQRGACDYCHAALPKAPVETIGAQLDQALASFGTSAQVAASMDMVPGVAASSSQVVERTVMQVNGVTYHSVAEMPPEVRSQYENAMQAMRRAGLMDAAQQLEEARNPAPFAGFQPVPVRPANNPPKRTLLIALLAVIALLLAVVVAVLVLVVLAGSQ